MKILLIGPLPPPITGNSLVNRIITEKFIDYFPDIVVDKIDNSFTVLKEDIGRFSFVKVFSYLKRYLMLYKIINAEKIYISIGITFLGVLKYLPFILFAKIFQKEIIIHIHSNHLWKQYELLRGFKKKIFYYILSQANKGIVLSKSLRKNLSPFLKKEQIYILENFAEDFIFDSSIKKNTKELRIIFLSNLMIEKGILDLLQALLILQSKGVNFKSKIAGGIDPDKEKEIFSYFSKLSDNLEYLGVVEGQQKKELLDWGNVFVFPTYYRMEGQPICIFEAMATSNIILTTKHAGIPDVFSDSVNGFYVEKKSPNSIATKLFQIHKSLDSYKYIFKNNKEEANKKYKQERFLRQLYLILQ